MARSKSRTHRPPLCSCRRRCLRHEGEGRARRAIAANAKGQSICTTVLFAGARLPRQSGFGGAFYDQLIQRRRQSASRKPFTPSHFEASVLPLLHLGGDVVKVLPRILAGGRCRRSPRATCGASSAPQARRAMMCARLDGDKDRSRSCCHRVRQSRILVRCARALAPARTASRLARSFALAGTSRRTSSTNLRNAAASSGCVSGEYLHVLGAVRSASQGFAQVDAPRVGDACAGTRAGSAPDIASARRERAASAVDSSHAASFAPCSCAPEVRALQLRLD